MSDRHSGALQRIWIRARTATPRTKVKHLCIGVALLLTLSLVVFSNRSEPYSLPVERVCTDGDRPRPAKPLIVLVTGGSRSGTTYLYNLLRIVLRQRDPNTITGWYEDLAYATRYASPYPPKIDNFASGFLDAYKATGTTVLVKVHTLAHATRLFSGCDGPQAFQSHACIVDLVFVTHRDLGPQVNSLRRMGWAKQRYLREMSNPKEYCRSIKAPSPRLVEKDWELPETWASQAKGIAICHGQWLAAAGKKLALDMGMEASLAAGVEERVKLAESIIRCLPAHEHGVAMNSVAAVAEADALRPLDCTSWQAVNPITHLHRGHVASNDTTNEEDEGTRQLGYAAIERDSFLAKWRQTHGYN